MNLVVFGDSFVEGYTQAGPSEKGMCDCLRDILGIEVENIGQRSNGTVAISYDVLTYLRTRDVKNKIFLIVWSEWDRQYIIDTPNDMDSFFHVRGCQKKSSPFREEELNSDQIKRWQLELAYNGLCNALREAGVPFLMTSSQCNQMFTGRRVIGMMRNSEGSTRISFDKRPFKFIYNEDKIKEHWIEAGKPNNTLLDIITDNWLKDYYPGEEIYAIKLRNILNKIDQYDKLTPCIHPTVDGNKLIATTLAPYIRRLITNVTTGI